jgi:hypothetical protein
VRYINDDSGASVVRDLTGDAFIDIHATVVPVHAQERAPCRARGGRLGRSRLPRTSGHGFMTTSPPMPADDPGRGGVENICQTLAVFGRLRSAPSSYARTRCDRRLRCRRPRLRGVAPASAAECTAGRRSPGCTT